MDTEEKPHEDTMRKHPSAIQGEKPQTKANLTTLSLHNCKKNKFPLIKPPSECQSVWAALSNYTGAFPEMISLHEAHRLRKF